MRISQSKNEKKNIKKKQIVHVSEGFNKRAQVFLEMVYNPLKFYFESGTCIIYYVQNYLCSFDTSFCSDSSWTDITPEKCNIVFRIIFK